MTLTNTRAVCVCLLTICLGFSRAGLPRLSSGARVSIDPAVNDVEPGQAFTVAVMIDDAADLGAFQFDLVYDPAVLTATDVGLGPFLGSTGRTAQSIGARIDNTTGKAAFGAFSFGGHAGADGTGLLATVSLTAVSPATCDLGLQNVKVTDSRGNVQSVSVEGGTVAVAAPAPTSIPTMAPTQTQPPAATPSPTSTATTAAPTEAATTVPPTDATTETATSQTPNMSTASPLATATATPAVTPSPTPLGPLTSAPAAPPHTQATASDVAPPTPGDVSPVPPTPTPSSPADRVATATATDIPSASPATAAPSNPPCWPPVGAILLLLAGTGRVLTARQWRRSE